MHLRFSTALLAVAMMCLFTTDARGQGSYEVWLAIPSAGTCTYTFTAPHAWDEDRDFVPASGTTSWSADGASGTISADMRYIQIVVPHTASKAGLEFVTEDPVARGVIPTLGYAKYRVTLSGSCPDTYFDLDYSDADIWELGYHDASLPSGDLFIGYDSGLAYVEVYQASSTRRYIQAEPGLDPYISYWTMVTKAECPNGAYLNCYNRFDIPISVRATVDGQDVSIPVPVTGKRRSQVQTTPFTTQRKSERTVVIKPPSSYNGYTFLRWSDGVATRERFVELNRSIYVESLPAFEAVYAAPLDVDIDGPFVMEKGQTAIFTAEANTTEPLRYHWYDTRDEGKTWDLIQGATSRTLAWTKSPRHNGLRVDVELIDAPTNQASDTHYFEDVICCFVVASPRDHQALSLRFSTEEEGVGTLEVFDALGRLVSTHAEVRFTPGDNAVRISTAGLANGLYVYRLGHDGTYSGGTFTVTR
ncbi:MAG: T9SS type A sorting domain-containing protein [Bacteroidota bacterium]